MEETLPVTTTVSPFKKTFDCAPFDEQGLSPNIIYSFYEEPHLILFGYQIKARTIRVFYLAGEMRLFRFRTPSTVELAPINVVVARTPTKTGATKYAKQLWTFR